MDLTPSHFGACSACFILKKCPYLLNHAFFWLFTLGPISRVKEKAHPNPSWFMSFTFSQVASDLPSSSRYRSLRYPASSDLCSGSAGESRAIFWPSPGSPRPDSPGFTQGTIHCKDVLGSTARFGTQLGIATHTQGGRHPGPAAGAHGTSPPLWLLNLLWDERSQSESSSRQRTPKGRTHPVREVWVEIIWRKKLDIRVRGWKWGCRRFRSTCSPASAHRPACRPAARGRRWGLPPFNWRMPTCGTGSRVSQMRWLSPRMAGECFPWLR